MLGLLLLKTADAKTAEQVSWIRSAHDCIPFRSPETSYICNQVLHAREKLETVHPRLIPDKKGGVAGREIIIAAGITDLHLITIEVPFRLKAGDKLTVRTPGYTVERVAGTALYKLQFRVKKDGEVLRVFGGKHVWIPQKYAKETRYDKLNAAAQVRQYLPFQDHLYAEELVERGKHVLEELVNKARSELVHVPSRSYKGHSLAEVFPTEVLVNLIVTEHTDPFKLFHPRTPITLLPYEYFFGVLVEIALHGEEAFAELCSAALACGWTQFTNTKVVRDNKVVWPGTYTYTYNECRDTSSAPVLLESFEEGTRDAKNAIKAAICYLDLENSALPQGARDEFRTDPKRGSVYMLAAFNAGGKWGRWLLENVQEFKIKAKTISSPLEHATLPGSLFARGTTYNLETHWYIKKYLWGWDLLYQGRVITVPVKEK